MKVRLTGAVAAVIAVTVLGLLVGNLFHWEAAYWLVALGAIPFVWLLGRDEGSDVHRYLSARILFEKRDAWIGLYWTTSRVDASALNDGRPWDVLHIYLCVLPFVPLLVTYQRKADA